MKLNRDQIKYAAVAAMTFNHVAHGLMTPGTWLYTVFEDIGYFTALTMCFFLIEGYHRTRSRKKYAARLFVCGLLSQIPYMLSQRHDGTGSIQPCIMFSLLICMGIVHVKNSEWEDWKKQLVIILLILLSIPCDWSFILPVAALLFEESRGDARKEARSYMAVAAIFFLANFQMFLSRGAAAAALYAAGASVGPIMSGIVVLRMYSGEKSGRFTRFNQSFFYLYYPLHLTVIAILRYTMGSFPAA